MRLRRELSGANVGYPDLDRTQALGSHPCPHKNVMTPKKPSIPALDVASRERRQPRILDGSESQIFRITLIQFSTEQQQIAWCLPSGTADHHPTGYRRPSSEPRSLPPESESHCSRSYRQAVVPTEKVSHPPTGFLEARPRAPDQAHLSLPTASTRLHQVAVRR